MNVPPVQVKKEHRRDETKPQCYRNTDERIFAWATLLNHCIFFKGRIINWAIEQEIHLKFNVALKITTLCYVFGIGIGVKYTCTWSWVKLNPIYECRIKLWVNEVKVLPGESWDIVPGISKNVRIISIILRFKYIQWHGNVGYIIIF